MSDEQQHLERIILHSAGPIPGIPGGSHGPGTYIINWEARTITPLVEDVSQGQKEAAESEE